MTGLSRGARGRRGGRRPGWGLLTTLLLLAIASSSALVFTERVALLKLAVILALWAAVAGAFVSVVYRRQSDADQARARDLKLVYDLQLDREISARREYELSLESQLRGELVRESQAQAFDDVAALRAELAALRTHLEILFDADLHVRPALGSDPATTRAIEDWTHHVEIPAAGRVTADRIRPPEPRPGEFRVVGGDARDTQDRDRADYAATAYVEASIVDVHEVAPEPIEPPEPIAPRRRRSANSSAPVTGPQNPGPSIPDSVPASVPESTAGGRRRVRTEGEAPASRTPLPAPESTAGGRRRARTEGEVPASQTPPTAPRSTGGRRRAGSHPVAEGQQWMPQQSGRSTHEPSAGSTPSSPADVGRHGSVPVPDSQGERNHHESGPEGDSNSVAELMARLQSQRAEGGRRRRRED